MEEASADHPSCQFAAKSFYSARNKKRYCELERNVGKRMKQFNQQNIPSPFPVRLLGPCTLWRHFHRQQAAIDFCRSKSEELHVFAFESETMGGEGQRMYLATSYPHFWHYYRQLKEEQRHHYEVITEGAVCKLYFDLEFPVENNPTSNGPEMVDSLIKTVPPITCSLHACLQYVCLWLQQQFRLSCSRQDVLDLDASTPKKFSRHLIFQLPNAAFQNNVAVGRFVTHIFSLLRAQVQSQDPARGCQGPHPLPPADRADPAAGTKVSNSVTSPPAETDMAPGSPSDVGAERESASVSEPVAPVESPELQDASVKHIFEQFSDHELRSLLVNSKDGSPMLFCDLGVYTKNRNFRLYLSSKLGRRHPLLLSAQNQFQPDAVSPPTPAAAAAPRGPAPSHSPQPDPEYLVFLASLVANVPYSSDIRILSMNEETPGRGKLSLRGTRRSDGNKESELLEGFQQSPYPEVDSFMAGLVGGEGRGGRLRRWVYFSQAELLIYDVVGYRWCHNVQRQHRSNNIIMVADLRSGVYYQKCHDPDCRAQNFKSPDEPLPAWVLPAHYFDSDEDETGEGGEGTGEGEGKTEGTEWDELADSSGDEACLLAAQAVEGEIDCEKGERGQEGEKRKEREGEEGEEKEMEKGGREKKGKKEKEEENKEKEKRVEAGKEEEEEEEDWDSDQDLAMAAQTLEDSLTA